MYNVYFEVASIGFILLLLLYLVIQYPNASVSNRRYRYLLIMLLASDILDVITALTIENGAIVNPILNLILNTAFFLVSAGLTLSFVSYIESFVWKESVRLKNRGLLYKICMGIYCLYTVLLIINLFTGCCFYFDESGQYIHGPLYPFTYGTSFCIVLLGFIFVFKYSKSINRRLRFASYLFLIMIISGSLLQVIFFKYTLLAMYFGTLAALILLFVIETPDYIKLEKTMKELEIARAKADDANRAKSLFLAKMSHEIRTPINAVIGMNEMILRDSSEKNIISYASDVQSASATLLSTINDILDLSKIESGKMELVPTEYDVSSMIYDVINMMSHKATDKNLDFQIEIDENLPSGLYGDDIRIKQVLINIINNAIKYTEKGNVKLSVNGVINEKNVLLHFEVKDTGIGIRKEDMEKLFSEFERIDEKRNKNIEGTGLGISIIVQLLNLMGSKLQVESEYGFGSRFWFDLTQEIRNPEAIGDLEQRISKQQKSSYKASFIAPNAKMLLVDDYAINRKVCRALLRDTQIQVDEASGGYECIEMVKGTHYDLILLDHMMPDLDGVKTLHELQKLGLVKNTPVIALTANAIAGASEMYISEGFTDFLSKPVRSDKMEDMLKRLLPKELIAESDESRIIPDNEEQNILPQVEGMDIQYALMNLGSESLLEETIHEFNMVADKDLKELNTLYEAAITKGDDEENIRQYRIKVHAMKNSAATIGALELSALAKILEYAAKDAEMNTIRNIHGLFIRRWNYFSKDLKGVYETEDATDKFPFNPSVFTESLNMLSDAMEICDIDASDSVIKALSYYDIPKEIKDDFDQLKIAVADIDEDEANRLIHNIKSLIEAGTWAKQE